MEKIKKTWRKVPSSIRKPLVLVFGLLFIIAAALTGWLPGPGGIPLFLIGIAILSTEYAWARRFRDLILELVYAFGDWYKRHRVLGTIALVLCAAAAIGFGTFMYRLIR
jgi:hypothetical protein